jgi:hypothetical protein
MKRIMIGAAGLLLSTSALAGTMLTKDPAYDAGAQAGQATMQLATATSWGGDLKDADKMAEAASIDATSTLDTAMADAAFVDKGQEMALAEADVTGKPLDTGMGGPLETADGSLDLTPRPATTNYPPCDPGPGDDNCIQLYEPGVEVALASWNQPTGGLADGSQAMASADTSDELTGVGGPYEGVDSDLAMAGDGKTDVAAGETEAAELASGDGTFVHDGVGGPVVETGYPPCTGSPSDDRCIQLYERGVTGEGN